MPHSWPLRRCQALCVSNPLQKYVSLILLWPANRPPNCSCSHPIAMHNISCTWTSWYYLVQHDLFAFIYTDAWFHCYGLHDHSVVLLVLSGHSFGKLAQLRGNQENDAMVRRVDWQEWTSKGYCPELVAICGNDYLECSTPLYPGRYILSYFYLFSYELTYCQVLLISKAIELVVGSNIPFLKSLHPCRNLKAWYWPGHRYFLFLLINVVFIFLLASTYLQLVQDLANSPAKIPEKLAHALLAGRAR